MPSMEQYISYYVLLTLNYYLPWKFSLFPLNFLTFCFASYLHDNSIENSVNFFENFSKRALINKNYSRVNVSSLARLLIVLVI